MKLDTGEKETAPPKSNMGLAIALGAGVGLVFGLFFDNAGIGLVIGAGLGIALGSFGKGK